MAPAEVFRELIRVGMTRPPEPDPDDLEALSYADLPEDGEEYGFGAADAAAPAWEASAPAGFSLEYDDPEFSSGGRSSSSSSSSSFR